MYYDILLKIYETIQANRKAVAGGSDLEAATSVAGAEAYLSVLRMMGHKVELSTWSGASPEIIRLEINNVALYEDGTWTQAFWHQCEVDPC